MAGRSRDARTWEFYCDTDARDALTEQAERERKGSAAGAISLLRSQSKKVLTPNSNKRNVNAPKPDPTTRLKANEAKNEKRKLNRAATSVARLQTVNNGKKTIESEPKKSKKGSEFEILEDPGDSDKENWEPGTRTRVYRRRRPINTNTSNGRQRAVLNENPHIPSQSLSQDPFLDSENRIPQYDQENVSAVVGEDNGNFVEYLRNGSLAREPDDLNAVQSLLSLSQGAWV